MVRLVVTAKAHGKLLVRGFFASGVKILIDGNDWGEVRTKNEQDVIAANRKLHPQQVV